ncbi:ribonuclease P protein component [Ramlibacter albus]|uniref:Ribonuclease P protein component n=1 Tax=Ramlibacter albus TaxID=2079448 RepID=A0A923M6E4_9BURK|nr:ribonuclease P protein component [Ramlibacter albus]
MQRIKTRAQFEAAMAGAPLSRTAHFVLHRAALNSTAPQADEAPALFGVQEPYIGAVVPKRWAKRAVTRNGIRRQIYNVAALCPLPPAAHVVRLRSGFAGFTSAWSEGLKAQVRTELQQLFARA